LGNDHGLNIPPTGALDFLSLGALVYRLDPGVVPFRKATECLIHVSGGEFNVAANLANCFGLSTGIASAMVDYPIGDLIAERVRAMGVQPFYKWFEHDGVTGPNMATVYSDRGFGVRDELLDVCIVCCLPTPDNRHRRIVEHRVPVAARGHDDVAGDVPALPEGTTTALRGPGRMDRAPPVEDVHALSVG